MNIRSNAGKARGFASSSRKAANTKTSKKGVVLSAFGRGTFVAHRLRKIGFEVSLWDLTSFLPAVSACEREGPFGVFAPSYLSGLQKRHLLGDNYYSVSKGFSCLSGQGLLEFQGPLRSFFSKNTKGLSALLFCFVFCSAR